MKFTLLPFLFVSFMMNLQAQDKAPCIACEELMKIRLPDVTILSSTQTPDGNCKVLGRISKEINFELLLPQKWNSRFLMGGGGGFVGSITNQFRSSVDSGFATAGTDTGHQGAVHQANWAFNNMERQLNFGRLAVHRTATVAKAVIAQYYGSYPVYSYFLGASRGGGQAMMEAQQYPEDFDGIVAFAPAISWPSFGAKFVRDAQVNYPDNAKANKPVITLDNLKLLQHYIDGKFDALDGVKDSIINNPDECKFDFSTLPVCKDDKACPDCFTKRQLEAIKSIYSPLVTGKDTIYPGFPFGGENESMGWSAWITGSDTSHYIQGYHFYFGVDIFKYFVFNDPSWDYNKYTFSDFRKETGYASSYLDATQTDYRAFKKKGGKLILVHGWCDPALSAYSTIDHYHAAAKRDKDINSFIKLYLLPGVLHFEGGPGPDKADWIGAITSWVEKNNSPDRIVMSKIKNGRSVMTRPVYPYPSKIKYDGKGDPYKETSYLRAENR